MHMLRRRPACHHLREVVTVRVNAGLHYPRNLLLCVPVVPLCLAFLIHDVLRSMQVVLRTYTRRSRVTLTEYHMWSRKSITNA